MANGTTFFSRFTMKFVEVIGAGIATAVTGYLIAHLGGFWTTPRTPAAIPASVEMVPAPAVSTMPKSARVSPPPQPPAVEIVSPAFKPEKPLEKPPAKPDAIAEKEPAAAPTPPARVATPARKSSAAEATSSEPKSREPKATEAKLRERDDTASVEEQVRAALAKVDAGHRPQPELAAPIESPAVVMPSVVPSVAVVPPPATPVAPSVATLPPAAVSVAPPAVSTVAPPIVIAPPLVGTVEIKSEPVATVDAVPAATPPDDGKSKNRGFLATIEHIPDMLRPAAGATTAEPPRPPMPVGQ